MIFCCVLQGLPGLSFAAQAKPPGYEDAQIRLRLIPRTPDQMAGFYEARGFPKAMVDTLKEYCFFTVGIRNKSSDIVWLELDRWRFESSQGEVRRIPRRYWPPLWKQMKVPMAAQSTFRWTLLPEVLDFRPDEHEGGNIVLKASDQDFSLTASFAIGADKQGGLIKARIDNLRCARDDE